MCRIIILYLWKDIKYLTNFYPHIEGYNAGEKHKLCR